MKGRQHTIRHALGSAALAVALALLACGCSEVGFPAVHDVPAPRADATLTPDQVKQATDGLICERDHLANEAQAGSSATTSPKPPSAPQKPCTPPPATTGSIVPASAYAKP